MDFKDMDPNHRKLVTALMIADMWRIQQEGILITKDINLNIGEDVFHYEGTPIRVKETDIITFGQDSKSMNPYLVEDITGKDVTLEKVGFYKAVVKLIFPPGTNTYCVASKDKEQAYKILKDYLLNNSIQADRILSMNYTRMFEPLITK